MLKVVYQPYKGYCIPKGKLSDKYIEDFHNDEKIVTNGFDKFNWSNEEPYTIDTGLDQDQELIESDANDSLYQDEAKIHLNHEIVDKVKPNSLSVAKQLTVSTNELSTKMNRKVKLKSKRLSKKEKKSLKNVKEDKNKNYEFNHNSDVSKVKQLNSLYKEILNIFQKSNDNLKNVTDDTKILQFFDISIYKEDLYNLKDDEWLNDNNISFIFEYLERYQLQRFHDDKLISPTSIILLRPSMVYLLANTPDPAKNLKGVLPPLESANLIFLPINDNDDVEAVGSGSHWSLVIISLLDRKAMIYDTLDKSNNREAADVIKKIIEYLNNDRFNEQFFQLEEVEKTPQQLNGSDCGILISQITGFLLSRALDLKHLENFYLNFDLNNVNISSIDGRIFVMGTILNILKFKQKEND
ncbi:hypothetical protein WICMUC_002378 [Wickerhamomyces mucosus]|uniref:Ubiquitin-like protease family profile domain-containing protein n=1 Tax=Wickerhamomyces mucosus TaxID=1378264 RepID=A0A9P8TEN3_9ASCO|nr:hypothetical protein WICMUC_002378 [Wickerhamomyces mucosus]